MNIELTALETRVIGCLIEKQITTPDQYPLSLNSLTNACNQKNNRDPVLDLNEHAVQQVLDGLVRKHLVIERSGFGSRVPKYQHVFCNTEFGSLKFSPIETAIICELLLRGAQMPGELRSRASRMDAISDVTQVESALQELMTRPDGPFVVRLTKEPGRRESRYMHLFSGAVEAATDEELPIARSVEGPSAPIDEDRLARLESLVDTLCNEIETLKRRLDQR
ncbi:MAG TPA: DUF480 domain-containing protein [Steroidobacteraceae bacterium]|nr:DUF480 domain-containing protein [Steroidobacteraceae bacterium]